MSGLLGLLGLGQGNQNSSTTTNDIMAHSVVQVEQYCMAQASNNLIINIDSPDNCDNQAGDDVINANVVQTGTAADNCSNSSSYEAMLRMVLTNSLKAVDALQNPQLSAAGAEGGDGVLGALGGLTMGSPLSGLMQHNSQSTSATNRVIETTNYSSLQQCRSHAQNLSQIGINDCKTNRILNLNVQQTASAMVSCVNNSNANITMATNIANTLTSSQTQTGMWETMTATIGNIIMLIALIGAIASVLMAFAAALVTKFTVKSQQAYFKTQAEIAQAQAQAAEAGASLDVVRAIGGDDGGKK